MKNDRLFKILYLLLEKGTVTAPELAMKLEVSVRTVYRDLDALSFAGVPVYATAGKGGGVSLMPGYSFDRTLLSDEEQNQILFALQSLRAAEIPSGSLLNKLAGLFQKPNAQWIEVDFSRWGYGKIDRVRFETLKSAILNRKVTLIQYCGAAGETCERKIQPIKLIFKDKNWYLQAFCLKAENYRLFKISRMIKTEVLDETFADHFTDLPDVENDLSTDLPTEPVTLRFSRDVAFRVFDEFDHASIEKQPDGRLTVHLMLPQANWIAEYLLSFGVGVEVLSPVSLREQLTELARKIYEHHKT